MSQEKMNKKTIWGMAMIGILFLFMLILNFWTPYIADDYAYMFVFGSGDKLTGFWQLFPSMYAHAFRMNGRLAPHFLVQLSMLLPKAVFNVCNAGMFCFLIWRLIRNAGGKFNRWSDGVLVIAVSMAYWYFVPAFGQVTLWCDGSWNYLWAMGFTMLYLAPYIRLYRNESVNTNRGLMVLWALFSLFFGDYSENLSFTAIIGAILMVCFVKFAEKRKVPIHMVVNIIFACVGYVFMYVCPAQLTEKAGTGGIRGMISGFYDCLFYYVNNCKWLILTWGVLLIIGVYTGIKRKTIGLSLLFFLLSLAANFIYMVASYFPERCMCGAIILLIEAIVVLLVGVREKTNAMAIWILTLMIGIFGLLGVVEGIVDIHSTYKQSQERMTYIEQCQQNGDTEVTLTPYVYTTKYSPAAGLRDLAEESDTWPNEDIAAFYGFEKVNRQK